MEITKAALAAVDGEKLMAEELSHEATECLSRCHVLKRVLLDLCQKFEGQKSKKAEMINRAEKKLNNVQEGLSSTNQRLSRNRSEFEHDTNKLDNWQMVRSLVQSIHSSKPCL